MNDLRRELHNTVDQLSDSALEHAKTALDYVAKPGKYRISIERAKERARQNSERHLREWAERTGRGFISGLGSGGGSTAVDGTHHSSMVAFVNGKDARYHIYVFRGHIFEILETIELSDDGRHILRREIITGPDGIEHTVTTEIPTAAG
jgi:hypothetical protein